MNKTILVLSVICILVALVWAGLYFFSAPTQEAAMPGSISGSLSYPSEGVPSQRVCAQPTRGGEPICVTVPDALDGVSRYRIADVPPGTYEVYAQLADPASLGLEEYEIARVKAYYTEFVLCGLGGACDDHTIIPVVVVSGQEASNIDPVDWYR